MEVPTNHLNHFEVALALHSNKRVIKHKLELLNLAEELRKVSKPCQMMGLSRDPSYRYKAPVEENVVEALLKKD